MVLSNDRAIAVVELLVARGADVNARTELGTGPNSDRRVGETALSKACRSEGGTREAGMVIAGHLLVHGANPNLENTSSGETPLFYAIRKRNAELVERLLDAGADRGHVNRKGERAIDAAMDTMTFGRRRPVDPRIVELLRAKH